MTNSDQQKSTHRGENNRIREEPPLEGQIGYKGPAFLRKLIFGFDK